MTYAGMAPNRASDLGTALHLEPVRGADETAVHRHPFTSIVISPDRCPGRHYAGSRGARRRRFRSTPRSVRDGRTREASTAMSGSLAGEGPTGTAIRGGVRWGVTSQALTQVLSLVATVVLARLLDPDDFGVVALAQSIVGVVSVLSALGFGTSIVRRPSLTREDVDGALWAAALVGSVLTLVTLAIASVGGALLSDDRARGATLALAPLLLVNTIASVPAGLLQRRMHFKWLYGAQLTGAAVYVAVQLVLAWAGMGLWAVIIGLLVSAVATLLLTAAGARLSVHRASPWLWFRREGRFAAGLLGVQGVTTLNKNADYWIVGFALGADALGRYYMAFVLPSIIRLRLSWVLGTVLLPVFTRVEVDSEELRVAYQRSTALQLGAGAALLVGIAVVSEPLLTVGLGERWAPAWSAMSVISLAMLVELLGTAPQRLAIAKARLGPVLTSEAVGLGVLLVAAAGLLAWRQQLVMVAWAVLASRSVVLFCSLAWVARPFGVGLRLIRRELLATVVSAAVMATAAGSILMTLQRNEASPWLQLSAAVPAGALTYVATLRLLFRPTYRQLRADLILIVSGR